MRNRLAMLIVLPTLILATACANPYGSAGPPVESQDYQIQLASGPLRTSRENVDRYTCADQRPLVCECLGRFSRSGPTCECRCPIAP